MFQFQIQVKGTGPGGVEYKWESVRQSSEAKPYEYETYKEARNMANTCYGSMFVTTRIVEVDSDGQIIKKFKPAVERSHGPSYDYAKVKVF